MQAVKKWIESIEELHQSKPSAGVAFTKPMPEIEPLMQANTAHEQLVSDFVSVSAGVATTI